MSFFGGQKQDAGPDPVVAAKTEMEVYTGERERQEDDLMMDPPVVQQKNKTAGTRSNSILNSLSTSNTYRLV